MAATAGKVRCTYCGGRGDGGALVEVDLRGIRYDYCDAACATAHAQAVELTEVLCGGCDEPAVGDTGRCDEHLLGPARSVAGGTAGVAAGAGAVAWRKAG